jgi:serine/threonine-protein kinase HipA
VWLYGLLIGWLSEPRPHQMRFEFSPEAASRFRAGSPILSTSMPVDPQRRPRRDLVRAFFTGLLPEGQARDAVAREFGVAAGDHFGLLEAIGRDCAGAVVINPDDGTPPGAKRRVEPLSEHDLARLVGELRERPLGADPEEDVRISLAGVQEKLLLARTSDGGWGRPAGGAPSTHIVKPQDMRFEGYAAAESFCLRLARRLGLCEGEPEVVVVDERPAIIVPRYDRTVGDDGTVQRVHQEDACQALGVDPESGGDKYESYGGPSLRRFANLMSAFGQPGDLAKLLTLTTLNVAVGNADAHAKNLSIMHPPDGTVRLAPAYDITPTTFYRQIPTPRGQRDMSDQLGMWVNSKHSVHRVTASDLAAEGGSWGLSREDAGRIVQETLEVIAAHSAAVAAETGLPTPILTFVTSRTEALRRGGPAGTAERVTGRHANRRP